MKKRLAPFILLLTVATFIILLFYPEQVYSKARAIEKTYFSESPKDSTIKLVAVGDIMMGTNFPSSSHLPPQGSKLLQPLEQQLRSADITFGNLEGTVLNAGGEVKKCSNPSKCYAFRQPEYFVDQLKDAGFDFLSLANNHMGDFGNTGRTNTQQVLKKKGLHYAGLESCPWDTMTKNGIKYGFTAFAPNSGCLRINDYSKAQEIVRKLNAMCDIVIVSFHGGAEGSSKTHITKKTEIFLGENRGNVYEFARKVIDAGADVVLGHGPHVTRAIDYYKGRFITYSMGNFCTYSRFNLRGISGMAPLFELNLAKDGQFISGKIVSTKQLGEGGPVPDPEMGALKQIRTLCKQDLPELKVQIDDSGVFRFN
ncbi:MAG: CapA family protein [Bacteroidetes bacterium]|nr:MAG: CapA family protein [Bacteroidota bacterium]